MFDTFNTMNELRDVLRLVPPTFECHNVRVYPDMHVCFDLPDAMASILDGIKDVFVTDADEFFTDARGLRGALSQVARCVRGGQLDAGTLHITQKRSVLRRFLQRYGVPQISWKRLGRRQDNRFSEYVTTDVWSCQNLIFD